MQQHYKGRVTVIVLVLLAALWAVFPDPSTWFSDLPFARKLNLKPGIDMAGGTKLIYDIKPPSGGVAPADLAERVMDALKKRVDPDGVRNLVWRPQGSQLEIQMPRSAETEVAEQKQAVYLSAQQTLEATNVRPGQVIRAVEQLAGDARAAELKRLAGDSPARADLFARMTEAYDRVVVARAGDDLDAEARALIDYEALRGEIAQTNVSLTDLQGVLDLPTKEREKELPPLLAQQGLSPLQQQALAGYVTAFDEFDAVRSKISDTAELKRRLRGAGVLDFHILVDDYNTPEVQQMLERLQGREGTRIRGTDTMAWFEVSEPARFGYRTQTHAGREWALAYITPERSMTNQDGRQNWALEQAYPTRDSMGGLAVGFRFDAQGAAMFSELTGNNLKRVLGAMLDNKIISAATIQSRIGREGIINRGGGGYDQSELRYLVSTLNAGSLPAQLAEEPIQEQTVGPQLGQDNLMRGLWASAFGLVVVAVFLIGYYHLSGVIATTAVLLNLVLILGAMALFNATFTLPGIAGIILTVGMAVDANVLIFERLREEQQRGVSLRLAIRNAYDRAFSAIVDSNLVTGITALILYLFGSEEVKGFGLTLIIGIAASLFTALFVTRTLFDILLDKYDLESLGSLPTSFPKWGALLRPNIDWMKLAPMFAAFSAVFLVAGLILFGVRFAQGQMLDIEFAEGTSVQFELVEATPQDEVRALIDAASDRSPAALPSPSVVAVGGDNAMYEVVTPNTDTTAVRQAVVEAMGGRLKTTIPSTFDSAGVAIEQAVSQGRIVAIESATQAVAGFVPASIGSHIGGAALVLDNLNPPLAPAEVRKRIERQRLVSGEAGYRGFDVDSASDDENEPASTLVVLVSDPEIPFSGDPEMWTNSVAAPMWRVTTDAVSKSADLQRVKSFGAQVARSARNDATVALVLSLLMIMAYVWVRFGNLKYGTATVVALLHDTLFVIAAIGISHYLAGTFIGDWLKIEPFRINLTMIAAILTVMGYSMNDTVVVFDRIRENRGKFGHLDRTIVNDSINQTLSRTLLTGGTTLVTIAVMYLMGGTGIHGFTFALLVGILVGTYSSIAIAAPILLFGAEREEAKQGGQVPAGQLQRA